VLCSTDSTLGRQQHSLIACRSDRRMVNLCTIGFELRSDRANRIDWQYRT
jgi:hypothetical protein